MESACWKGTHNPKVALLPLIQGMLPTLKRAQRRIAEAIVVDPEQFVSHSISQLAVDYGVSAGSIVIFCKSLGLRGFPALKIAIARELSEPVLLSGKRINQRDGFPSILEEVFERHIESLRQTLKLNTPDSFDAAVKSLLKARRVSSCFRSVYLIRSRIHYAGAFVLLACRHSLSLILISNLPRSLNSIEAKSPSLFPLRETRARPWSAFAWLRNAERQPFVLQIRSGRLSLIPPISHFMPRPAR